MLVDQQKFSAHEVDFFFFIFVKWMLALLFVPSGYSACNCDNILPVLKRTELCFRVLRSWTLVAFILGLVFILWHLPPKKAYDFVSHILEWYHCKQLLFLVVSAHSWSNLKLIQPQIKGKAGTTFCCILFIWEWQWNMKKTMLIILYIKTLRICLGK